MKTLVRFFLVAFLFLSTNLFAQKFYKATLKSNKLYVESVNDTVSLDKNSIYFNSGKTPTFEYYLVKSKTILGVGSIFNLANDIEKYKLMDNGDTLIGNQLKYTIDNDCVEFYYYDVNGLSKGLSVIDLSNTNFLIINGDLKFNIKDGKLKKETL